VRLSWVIVAHESEPDLELFLPTLMPVLDRWRRRGVSCELIIVDNKSSDNSVAVARRLAPDALLIENSENVGYGWAINTAVRRAKGEWVAIGNADLMVPDGGLDALPEVLASLPDDVALAGPTLLDLEGNHTLSAGFFPTLATLVKGLVRDCRDRKYLPFRRHQAGPVDWVTGACLFARRSHLEQAGGFDQEYFLYYEDVDLAQRMSRAGKLCTYAPTIRMVHLSPHHVRPPQVQIEAIVRSSRKAYFAKHRPVWERACLALLCRLELIIRRPRPQTDVPAPDTALRPAMAIDSGPARNGHHRAQTGQVNGHGSSPAAEAELGDRSAALSEALSVAKGGDDIEH
jgi:GT2 family glycosyltransferase